MATLTIQLPGFPPVAHVLKDDTITVGRMKGNTIVIDDASVSLTHARITRKNGESYLKDLNSTNGTVVNGQRINEARLRDGDRVAFADVAAQFQAEAPAETTVPAPAPILPAPRPAQPQPAPTSVVAPSQPAPRIPSPAPLEPARAFSFAQLVTRVVSVLGGVVALGVVSFLGWKMLHGGFNASPVQAASQASVAAPAVPKPASVAVKQVTPAATVAENLPAVLAANPGSPALATPQPGAANVSQLALALRDPDPAERRRAATALHSMGVQAKEAAPALREALNDTDQDVRMWAALTLVNNELHDKATIPILIGVLQRENPVLRQVACLSLGLIPYEDFERDTVVPALTETASKDTDDEVRKAAISALNIIAPEAAAKAGLK